MLINIVVLTIQNNNAVENNLAACHCFGVQKSNENVHKSNAFLRKD